MIDPKAVLDHHSKPVPRYTSYPTAPQFKAGAGAQLFNRGIVDINPQQAVSAYLHIPFCDRLCWFCGCHTKHTLKYAPIERYMRSLIAEIELFSKRMPGRPRLGQLHLGGGSPSLLKRGDLLALRAALETAFEFTDTTEISIEIDPSDITDKTFGSAENEQIASLIDFGLTRASVGVQDFHEEVQAAINRPQSFEITRDVIFQLRDAGVSSINVDALYGLPLQSQDRLLKTIEQCVSLQPDRMALFGYAHVPWLKKHQNMIRTEDLAKPLERFHHARLAAQSLTESGYDAIGIDHFALPDDALSLAARNGQLRRNFQGYTTDHHATMFGFGASSIGRFADGYVQNTVPTAQYQMQVSQAELPKNKGLMLSPEDKLRGHIIERLMCDFEVDFSELDGFPSRLVEECFNEAKLLAAQDRHGLCEMENTRLLIPDQARSFARLTAAHFDAYYAAGQFQYSKAV